MVQRRDHPPKKLGDFFSNTPCNPYFSSIISYILQLMWVSLHKGQTILQLTSQSQSPLTLIEFLQAFCTWNVISLAEMIYQKRSSSVIRLVSLCWTFSDCIFNQFWCCFGYKIIGGGMMIREEEYDEASLSNIQAGHSQQAQPVTSPMGYENRVRHVYLEEENAYGRYVPFLLLKDKLHSQIDTSGTSALAHMCSHNSPYLPLYLSTLKKGDPILNRPTNMGHTPLDIAGMYCRREYIDLLREKGAEDNGKVDVWAIQGANIANWSGRVDPEKKALIHWAAYNNFPEVLQEFYRAGANVNDTDEKGNTPIDMAVINKSYQSVEALARLGFRPKASLLQKAQSRYLNKLFEELDRSECSHLLEQSLKLTLVPLILLFQLLLADFNAYFILLEFAVYICVAAKVPGQDSKTRPTSFFSQLVNRDIVYGYNHMGYLILMFLLVVSGFGSLKTLDVTSLWLGFYFCATLGITVAFSVNLIVLVYGVLTNTTPSQMFKAHKHLHLWQKIDYYPHKNIVMRAYKNQNRKDWKTNLSYYWKYRAE